jgi:GNAT superfamily N-acetyltransferase
MAERTYQILSENPDTLRAELLEGLRVFNEGVAGPYNLQPLSLAIRNDDGALIGGLVGLFYWNMLNVDLLWVAQNHRRGGCGTALLTRAERMAAELGCEVIYLATYTFQAPDFYTKRGYAPVGMLNDAPKGFATMWFAKRIVPQ